MAIDYAKRLKICVSESRLGVIFFRIDSRGDGAPGAAQYWNHAKGGWDNELDPADHIRPLDRPIEALPACQTFAVPGDVADVENTMALMVSVTSDGQIAQPIAPLDNMELNFLRGWVAAS